MCGALVLGRLLTLRSTLAPQLDEYQEQSYLLDPHLESIVVPAVQALQELVRQSSSVDAGAKRLGESPHVQRLARLLYCYTKVRGYKTISELQLGTHT